ncbi:MAG: hypothetical protein Q4B63_01650 [Clostridium perfringens]|nr:hypothetical protein [Clostridium perfringens]
MNLLVNILNVIFNLGINTVVLFFLIIGFLIIQGLIIGRLEKISMKNIYSSVGYIGILITSIGVCLHETSHFLVAKIFNFKIKEVKLFRPIKGKKDGVLGYVSYSYNPNNILHKIGLFFVGFAPLLGGILGLLLSIMIFLPNVFNNLSSQLNNILSYNSIFSFDFLQNQLLLSLSLFKDLFTLGNFKTIPFWIFLILAISISSHMALSIEDLKGAYKGIKAILLILFIFNFLLYIFNINIYNYISYIYKFDALFITLMNISICFSILHLFLTYVIKFIISPFKR